MHKMKTVTRLYKSRSRQKYENQRVELIAKSYRNKTISMI